MGGGIQKNSGLSIKTCKEIGTKGGNWVDRQCYIYLFRSKFSNLSFIHYNSINNSIGINAWDETTGKGLDLKIVKGDLFSGQELRT